MVTIPICPQCGFEIDDDEICRACGVLIEDIPVQDVSLTRGIGEVLTKVQGIGLHGLDNNLLRDDVSDDPSLSDVMGNSYNLLWSEED
jgi:hypothetical protein